MKNRIKEIRKSRGMSQEALGEHVGLQKAGISKLERGSVKLTTEHISKIAKALKCEPWELFSDTSYEQPALKTSGFAEAPSSGYVQKIPVWGVADAQDGERYAINMEDTPVEWIEPLPMQSADKAAFGVLVAGESMSPKYEPGNIACVNTRKPAIKGQDCVIEFSDGSGLIKKYIGSSADEYIFEQLNPHKQLKFPKKDVVRILPVVGVIFR